MLFTNPEDRFSHGGLYNPYHKTNIFCHTNNIGKGQNTLSLSALLVVHSSLQYNVGGSYFVKCLPIGCRLQQGFVSPNLESNVNVRYI